MRISRSDSGVDHWGNDLDGNAWAKPTHGYKCSRHIYGDRDTCIGYPVRGQYERLRAEWRQDEDQHGVNA